MTHRRHPRNRGARIVISDGYGTPYRADLAAANSYPMRTVFSQRSSGRAPAKRQRQFFFELPPNNACFSRVRDQGKPLEGDEPSERGDQEDESESADTEHMYREFSTRTGPLEG